MRFNARVKHGKKRRKKRCSFVESRRRAEQRLFNRDRKNCFVPIDESLETQSEAKTPGRI